MWWKIDFSIKEEKNWEWLTSCFYEFGALGVEEENLKGKVYFPEDVKEDFLRNEFTVLEKKFPELKWDLSRQERENWQENWRENFHPIIVNEKLSIRAPWHDKSDTEMEVVIEPNLAFGTGGHETTRLMLEAMLKTDFSGKKVLDVGCGSGILSFTASLLQADSVMGFDIDHTAVEYANLNYRKWNVDLKNIRLECLTISEISGIYPIILMNMIFSRQEKIFANTVSKLDKEGVMVLSGILKEEEKEYKKMLEKYSLKVKEELVQGEWLAFIARFS